MLRRKGAAKPDEQGRAFIAKARELGCDEDPEAFERVFARVVPPKTPPTKIGTGVKRPRTSHKRGKDG